MTQEKKQVILFTDGASRGNPGPGGWGAIMVYPDSHDILKVDELGGREDNTTNNRMEISAAVEGLAHIDGFYENLDDVSFVVYTDSAYLLNGATKWIHGWRKKDWITVGKEDVKNRDLWERLATVLDDKKIEWRLVPGHSDVPGNEQCDVIATAMADKKPIELYHGNFSGYVVKNLLDILNVNHLDIPRVPKNKSSNKGKAFSYISAINGKVETHATWAECEARVKGKSGARFKKSTSKEDEENIIKEFSR